MTTKKKEQKPEATNGCGHKTVNAHDGSHSAENCKRRATEQGPEGTTAEPRQRRDRRKGVANKYPPPSPQDDSHMAGSAATTTSSAAQRKANRGARRGEARHARGEDAASLPFLSPCPPSPFPALAAAIAAIRLGEGRRRQGAKPASEAGKRSRHDSHLDVAVAAVAPAAAAAAAAVAAVAAAPTLPSSRAADHLSAEQEKQGRREVKLCAVAWWSSTHGGAGSQASGSVGRG